MKKTLLAISSFILLTTANVLLFDYKDIEYSAIIGDQNKYFATNYPEHVSQALIESTSNAVCAAMEDAVKESAGSALKVLPGSDVVPTCADLVTKLTSLTGTFKKTDAILTRIVYDNAASKVTLHLCTVDGVDANGKIDTANGAAGMSASTEEITFADFAAKTFSDYNIKKLACSAMDPTAKIIIPNLNSNYATGYPIKFNYYEVANGDIVDLPFVIMEVATQRRIDTGYGELCESAGTGFNAITQIDIYSGYDAAIQSKLCDYLSTYYSTGSSKGILFGYDNTKINSADNQVLLCHDKNGAQTVETLNIDDTTKEQFNAFDQNGNTVDYVMCLDTEQVAAQQITMAECDAKSTDAEKITCLKKLAAQFESGSGYNQAIKERDELLDMLNAVFTAMDLMDKDSVPGFIPPKMSFLKYLMDVAN